MRVAVWPQGTRGTVFWFPGRTEYVEKYSDGAQHLHDAGFASVAIDWRGQGLTERPDHGHLIGHVNDFKDFQLDVDAMLDHARRLDLPRPWHLFAHSMGGLIGLRSVMTRHDFQRAVFSAPMWGIQASPAQRISAWTLSSVGTALGLGARAAPFTGKARDPAGAPFEGNVLTSDAEMFRWMKNQLRAHPELALGGPSLSWLIAALREMHNLARRAAPDVPVLGILGTKESIVSSDAIHVRLASWPGARLEIIEGARHEAFMEDAATRRRLYDLVIGHFTDAAAKTAS